MNNSDKRLDAVKTIARVTTNLAITMSLTKDFETNELIAAAEKDLSAGLERLKELRERLGICGDELVYEALEDER